MNERMIKERKLRTYSGFGLRVQDK